MSTDWSDDDFVEIPRHRARPDLALVMRCVELGSKRTRRVQFMLLPSLLLEIGGPRYAIAYAPNKRMFRIQATERGQYEPIRAGRGEKLMLRCEMPPQMVFSAAVADPEHYVDGIGKAIMIEVPETYFAAAPRQLPPPAATPAAAATAIEQGRYDADLAATLGLTATFPRRLGDVHLTQFEAAILEVLYRHPRASRDALMMATATDPAEDERDDKIIDVMMARLRKKLAPLSIEIQAIKGEGFALTTGAKAFLRRAIGEAA